MRRTHIDNKGRKRRMEKNRSTEEQQNKTWRSPTQINPPWPTKTYACHIENAIAKVQTRNKIEEKNKILNARRSNKRGCIIDSKRKADGFRNDGEPKATVVSETCDSWVASSTKIREKPQLWTTIQKRSRDIKRARYIEEKLQMNLLLQKRIDRETADNEWGPRR